MSRRCTLLLVVLALTGCAQLGLGEEKCSLDGRCARAPSAYAIPAESPAVAAADAPVR
jgi:hypothetical protein